MWRTLARGAGLFALLVALSAAGWLGYLWCCGPWGMMSTATAVPPGQSPVHHERVVSGRESGAGMLLIWAAVIAALGALGAHATWRGRAGLVGVVTTLLLLLSYLGMFSIGMYILPAALAFALAWALAAVARVMGPP